VGLQAALQAEPDGYTLVLGQMGGMAVAPNVNRQPFDVRKEFVAIASTFSNYLVLASYAGLPQKTFPEVVSFAKAPPGKLRMATNGEGGFPHLAMELLKERTGFDFLAYAGAKAGKMAVAGHETVTVSDFDAVAVAVLL
jgi:tripartite-type tricarboxylate transporter receptor subunit TctC